MYPDILLFWFESKTTGGVSFAEVYIQPVCHYVALKIAAFSKSCLQIFAKVCRSDGNTVLARCTRELISGCKCPAIQCFITIKVQVGR